MIVPDLSIEAIKRTLQRVDWNFPAATTPQNTVHSFHWFPGNFIPQIPSFMIQLLSQPGEVVSDPFCGSGTTAVEALLLGRIGYASDINRASIQVALGKIAALTSPGIHMELRSLLGDLVWDSVLGSTDFGRCGEGSAGQLSSWYHENTLAQLRYIWKLRDNIVDDAVRSVVDVLFADTLFACASSGGAVTSSGGRRRHHWGWVADNVVPKPPLAHNAIKMFRDRLSHAAEVLKRTTAMPSSLSHVGRVDARSAFAGESAVDLVVTSPPYLGMIDYTKANRLTYLWMGWSLEDDRREEIGARYKRRRHGALEEYQSEMNLAAQQIAASLRPGGFCALVIGASRAYPEAVPAVLALFADKLDWVWGPEGRLATRRRVTERRDREPQEWICVFQKPS